VIALHMARREGAALARIAGGDAGREFSEAQRAYACVALGRLDEARALYDIAVPGARGEIDEVLNDDWVWRLPHWITRAHLRLARGDTQKGRTELEDFIKRANRLAAEGVWSGEVRYWAATAHALLGEVDRAAEDLRAAVAGGWRHAWWAKLDWNLRDHLDDPRIAGVLRDAEAVKERT
jgi:tetratricopeptide (TPR) repeat protein